MKYKILAVFAVLLMTLSVVPAVCAGNDRSVAAADNDDEANFLIDYGNGFTDWYQGGVNGPSSDIAVKILTDNGIEASFSGSELTVDGITRKTVGSGSTGGSLAVPGTTGITHDVRWHFFRWDSLNLSWKEVDAKDTSTEPLAIAYYPDGIAPVVSPSYRSAWTMVGVDANNSYNTTAAVDPENATLLFECFPGAEDTSGVYSSILYAKGHIMVKYGWTQAQHPALIACYSQSTGELEWKFYMPDCMLETTTALVVGDYLFIQTMGRVIYRVNYIEGPGEPDKSGNYPNVISMEGKAMKDITEDDKMPLETVDIAGKGYGYGMGSMIYSDGLILGKAHNGMFYAFDTDLHLVWSYQSTGSNYFTSVTCMYEMVFGGTLDGNIYVLDVNDGSLISNPQLFDIVKDTSAWDFSTSTITSKSTALYAKWTPVGQSFTVAFDMNGHGGQTASQTVPNGGRATEPADPAAEGFTFGGWYKDKECKKPWNFRTDVVSKDTTIYAKWTAVGQSFTVTFDMKGHGDPVAPLTVPDGGRIPVPADPTAEEYIFSGWYKDEKYSDPWNFRTNSVSADTTLYAKWVDGKASIDIAFNVLSRSQPIDDQTVPVGGRITEPADPVAEGYTFGGWYSAVEAVQPMSILVFEEGNGAYRLFFTWSTTQLASSQNGYAVCSLDLQAGTFENISRVSEQGGVSNYMTAYTVDGKPATLLSNSDGVCTLAWDGTCTVVSGYFKEAYVTHAAFTLVNGNDLYLSTYQQGEGKENQQSIYLMHMDSPEKFYRYTPSTLQYAMAAVTVVDGLIMCGNDAGMYVLKGSLEEYTPPVIVKPTPIWMYVVYALIVVVAALAVIWCVLRFGMKWERPFDEIKRRVMTYFYGEQYTHNTKSKRKLRVILLFGVSITVIMAIVSLCIGSERMLGPGEALGAMISSIAKGGRHLTLDEMLIYNQRLPRALAAISVGIGLSVAGAVYQAIIKNPLVEPYIMGVSSGAGTFAIAVMIYGFTFFGLFPEQSPYLIAVAAIFGGLLAFGLTLLLSLKTGGKPVNYVLSGIIIGLVFQAIQSVMMIGNGTKASNAIAWLYGSFTSITWETIWVVMIPCILLSIVPLIWSKELNLVLLGEDQAMQMGLNAKRFDALMLVIVSVLTAFCVAFCGIIGFVGLVIPHLARLIIGGDHRLMLPVSMAFGGFLLLTADILSRVLLVGYELPVGAITTIIGVPVFAYLLIKRGRSYDG